MKKFIATTTINNRPETTSYSHFLNYRPDWTLVIAGDVQTDDDIYRNFVKGKNAVYLSIEDQKRLNSDLHNILGEKTDTRKMFSIYYAYEHGADVIALIDDDNYPLKKWGQNLILNEKIRCNCYYINKVNINVVDPISVVKYHPYVWHRGYPLKYVKFKENLSKKIVKMTPYIQADLWYNEPDVDALCRILVITKDFFATRTNYKVFPFTTSRFSPFNSQNTFLHRRIIPYYFLFRSLGRMSDIWISYYIESLFKEPIVIYNKPTVFQKRNTHDIIKDFNAEIKGYLYNEDLVKKLEKDPSSFFEFLTKEESLFYKEYVERLRKKLL